MQLVGIKRAARRATRTRVCARKGRTISLIASGNRIHVGTCFQMVAHICSYSRNSWDLAAVSLVLLRDMIMLLEVQELRSVSCTVFTNLYLLPIDVTV